MHLQLTVKLIENNNKISKKITTILINTIDFSTMGVNPEKFLKKKMI